MGRVRDWWGSGHATRIRACRAWSTSTRGGGWVAKDDCLWSTGRKDHAPSGETKFKLEMAQSITDAISTGRNRGMWWNNSVFCNELINYAVRIVPYHHCILITSSHKIKLWVESALALTTTTTTQKLANNTGAKRFQHDSPLILPITQIPLNNHNWRPSCKKGVYRFFGRFSFFAGSS